MGRESGPGRLGSRLRIPQEATAALRVAESGTRCQADSGGLSAGFVPGHMGLFTGPHHVVAGFTQDKQPELEQERTPRWKAQSYDLTSK